MDSPSQPINQEPGIEATEKPSYFIFIFLLALVALVCAFWRMGDKISLMTSDSRSGALPTVSGTAVFSLLQLNQKPLRVEIVRTPSDLYRGLSDRPSLCADCGMLFLFPDRQSRHFVMRRMNFPLDMVWLAGGKIVSIDRNLAPEAAEPYSLYGPVEAIDAVLEINANSAAAYGLTVGQTIDLPQ